MNFNEIRVIVRDYISDVTADVDQHILDAVNFLSFVFSKNKIDETQTTTVDQNYIDKPDHCLKVVRVEIDGDEILEAVGIENLETAEDEEAMRWFVYDDKIQLTKDMDEDGQVIKIWYASGYQVDSGGDWNETQPAGDNNETWHCVASNSDGSKLIIGYNSGRLYTSSDGGATWTERRPAGDVSKLWYSVASDSDGSNLIACATGVGGRLYTSSDSGVTWTERRPIGDADKNWRAVASDDDGSNLIASVYSGRLYTSSDGGATWTERRPAGDADKSWRAVTSNSDGSKLVAVVYIGRIYTSSDGGATWTERRPIGDADKYWHCVSSSLDGLNLIVGASSGLGRLYTSSDGGVTWTERQPAGDVDKYWYSVASDDDGSNLIAGAHGGRLYISSDGGVTWTETGLWDLDLDWRAVASDADGSNLIAGIYDSRAFIFSNDLEVDVPDNLGELVYVGAAYRYYRKMVSTKVITPATYPDIELDEIRKVCDRWQEDYYTLLKNFVKFN